jgi:fluoride exporter
VSADAREMTAVFGGGAVGASLRAALTELIPTHPGAWPWATFAANLVGAALLAYFVTRLQERLPLSAYRRPFLGTGLCGALTTFSTMQLELVEMLERGRWGLALGYLGASLVGGLGLVIAATAGVRRVRTLR